MLTMITSRIPAHSTPLISRALVSQLTACGAGTAHTMEQCEYSLHIYIKIHKYITIDSSTIGVNSKLSLLFYWSHTVFLALCKHFDSQRWPAWCCLSKAYLWLCGMMIFAHFQESILNSNFCWNSNRAVLWVALFVSGLTIQLAQCVWTNIDHHPVQ